MKANFNNQEIDFEDLNLSFDDRGFRYGDGLFETMAVFDHRVRFLKEHYERMKKGAEMLRCNLDVLPFDNLERICSNLLMAQKTGEYWKMKLFVWRKGNGLYQPFSSEINYLVFVEPTPAPAFRTIENIDFSRKAINLYTPYSPLKTMSALKYVIAGLEVEEKKLDEIIIQDHEGNVSESLYSNIFMKKNNIYFTPPVSTGCVEGVMRNCLMETLKTQNFQISEKPFTVDDLMKAESVFLTNALGVKHILKIRNSSFTADTMIQELVDRMR